MFRYILFAFALGFIGTSHAQLQISQLTDSVYIYTTWQQLETGPYPANGMYVLTRDGAVMIDSPWDSTQVLPLLDSIRLNHNASVIFCMATHSHADRTGGFGIMNAIGIPTYSTVLTQRICREKGEGMAMNTFVNDTTFEIGGVDFETYFPGHGHAPDNIVVWFPKWEILYGGCFIKSTVTKSLGNVADANLTSWAIAVEKVRKRYRRPSYIIPGHLDWISEKSLQHTLQLIRTGK